MRQAERLRQADSPWPEHYRERARVEHGNQLLTRHGGRVSRYWGRLKVTLQLQIVSAVHNIEELTRSRPRRTTPV